LDLKVSQDMAKLKKKYGNTKPCNHARPLDPKQANTNKQETNKTNCHA
jgi:hypothetical protein